MKEYKEYKNSGISWIGKIPGHWELKRNKSFMSMTGYKVGENADLFTLLSLTINGVIVRDIESGKGKFPKDFGDYQVVKKNELIFCLFDIDETPRTVGLVNTEGMITGAYTALKVNKEYALPKYIYYYYLCVDNIKALRPYYSGLRKTIRSDKFLQLYLPLPPVKEQLAIVSYIDEKTAKIDEYIDKKNKEIEALKEWKKALIAHVVTKGLNTNTKMKKFKSLLSDETPSHWKIVRNKNIFESHYEAVSSRKNIPLLSLTTEGVILRDVSTGKGKFPKDFEMYNVVYPNNIIFCLFDLDETPRTVGLCYNYGMITNAYTTFKIKDTVLPEYITNYYLAADNIKALRPYYSGLRKVVQSNRFNSIQIPLPPIEEQQEIVEYIDAATTKADKMIVELTNHVESMKEYKQQLIADVVTGKINVQP